MYFVNAYPQPILEDYTSRKHWLCFIEKYTCSPSWSVSSWWAAKRFPMECAVHLVNYNCHLCTYFNCCFCILHVSCCPAMSGWVAGCLSCLCIVSKWLQIRPWLLRNVNRKPYPSFRMVPFWVTIHFKISTTYTVTWPACDSWTSCWYNVAITFSLFLEVTIGKLKIKLYIISSAFSSLFLSVEDLMQNLFKIWSFVGWLSDDVLNVLLFGRQCITSASQPLVLAAV